MRARWLDLDRDVRSLMSVEPNRDWYGTAHHELGHVYYYMTYTRPEVPMALRQGANRAYHEGIGSMIELASQQRRFLAGRKLVPPDPRVDRMSQLLHEALASVVFIPFAAGTMTRFEHALYAGRLPADSFNATWWGLARRYQGIVPPSPRDERWADGLTKTHVNERPPGRGGRCSARPPGASSMARRWWSTLSRSTAGCNSRTAGARRLCRISEP